MPTYIFPSVETDADLLAQEVFDYLEANVSDYEPAEGNLDTVLIEALARIASVLRDLESEVTTQIFRFYGASVIGLAPIDPSSASVDSTWTMIDDAGYTIPAGTIVAIEKTGDELVGFYVAQDVTVPPGATVTGTGEVVLVATATGENASGLDADPTLVDALGYVESISLNGEITTGGTDGELDDVYLSRLREELQLMAPRPILPNDFAVMARRIAGVARATAIDLYNPNDETDDNERMVTVAVVDENGGEVSSLTKTAVEDLLESHREVNFVVWVIDPDYTAVHVAYEVVSLAEYDTDAVKTATDAAIAAYVGPDAWGASLSDPTGWTNRTIVRYLEVAEVINRVDGVDYIETLLIGGGDGIDFVAEADDDTLTAAAHGLANGTAVVLGDLTGAAPLAEGTVYFVRDQATNTLKLAATAGGAAIALTSDGTGTLYALDTADVTLDGVAPLATPGEIDGTVTAP